MLSPEELKKAIQDEIKASKVVYKHYLEFKYVYEDEEGEKHPAGSAYAEMISSDKKAITLQNFEDYSIEMHFNPQSLTFENPEESVSFEDFACLIWLMGDVLYFHVDGDNTYKIGRAHV